MEKKNDIIRVVSTHRLTRLFRTEMTDGIGPVRPDAIISLQAIKRITITKCEKKNKEEFKKKDFTVS